jgi:hypothetical protein
MYLNDDGHINILNPKQLNLESCRLATFIDNSWENDIVTAGDLALFGFYYYKRDDYVKCAFCQIIVREFVSGDTALGEHIRHSPNCPFLRRMSHNEPICEATLVNAFFHHCKDMQVDNASTLTENGNMAATLNEISHGKCAVCLEKLAIMIFDPCHHVVTCKTCSEKCGNTCVICRKLINSKYRVFFA